VRELERDPPEAAGHVADTTALPRLAIVGRGRMGGAIERASAGTGLDVTLAGRDDAVASCANAEAALLCVPDAAIREACDAIAGCVPPLRFVGHVSGATGLDALEAATARGAAAFSLHPLQTVPAEHADLAGAPCAVAGASPEALNLARRVAEELGMSPFEVPEERRAAYHAAASIASNFLVALEESAAELLAAAGVQSPRELLAPLVLRSAANWSDGGDTALTGPIARGDDATVERHVEAIREVAPHLLPLYETLAARTRALGGGR
jgi:predicted short-subunit dehydrogenase-like oxidoreductase (DUF2520 family)